MAKKVLISGKVQGVSFRFHACEEATKLGLKGWVRNLPDGKVEMLVSGDDEKIQSLIKWAHQGPPAARVESVDVSDSKETAKEAFFIRREETGKRGDH